MRPHSQHLNDRAELLSRAHPERAVVAILGISRSTLFKMKRRGWVAPATTRPFRPRPADFSVQYRHATIEELAAHYGAAARTVRRWIKEEAAR